MDGTAIAAAKSCEIDVSSELIEVASPETGIYRKFIVGRKTWDVTVGYLVSNLTSHILKVGDTVTLTMGVRSGGHATSDRLTGSAIVSELRVSGTRGNLATGSFKFRGISSLTQLSSQLQSNEQDDLQGSGNDNLFGITI